MSAISPTTATVSGTNASTGQPQTLTISGSGFVQGASSVNFVQETGASGTPANTPSTANSPAGVIVTIPASQVTWGGCAGSTCTLTVPAPAVTSGTDYFVTVTTPGGTSPYLASPSTYLDFQVISNNVIPGVTRISGPDENNGVPGGSITGGSTVTITGSGFFNSSNFAAQVWFWPVGGGSKVQGLNVSLQSSGTLTAITPPVTSTGNYYAQVDTFGGSSTSTSAIFNYGVQVPIIISLSPSGAGAGTTLTINGYNFLSGSTVGFCLDTGGNYNANCVNPGTGQIGATVQTLTATQITVTVPTGLTKNSSYYPIVTLPSQYNPVTYPPSQPYNEPADVFTRTS